MCCASCCSNVARRSTAALHKCGSHWLQFVCTRSLFLHGNRYRRPKHPATAQCTANVPPLGSLQVHLSCEHGKCSADFRLFGRNDSDGGLFSNPLHFSSNFGPNCRLMLRMLMPAPSSLCAARCASSAIILSNDID